ncbi:hypothetical protein MB901379_03137 [Mycobacterium basiliense]|uniref:Uncharacterized protein n=1 Tax=Mycobacterium basiliense TaxID=2094119 RepID=A0A3S4CX87_9MYCO|nr:hypothetical protein MB901379_03137 [Mycobacterium basiliense]
MESSANEMSTRTHGVDMSVGMLEQASGESDRVQWRAARPNGCNSEAARATPW